MAYDVLNMLPEVESRTQGSRPRTALPRTAPLEAKDKNARGQGERQQVFSEKKDFQKFFQVISKKIGLQKFFSRDLQNFNVSENNAVLEPRTGQFSRTWGFEAKAKNLTFEFPHRELASPIES